MNLNGKVALVTGAGRGIGRAIVLELAKHGADCGICDIKVENAGKVVGEVLSLGKRGLAINADVTSETAVERMIHACMEEFGRVDILVNNAGITSASTLLNTTVDEWNRLINVNLKSVFLCCRAVLPVMQDQRGGKIINIASIAGKRGGGILGKSGYAAAKGGVIAFTKAVAREAAPFGINVNAITPGLTATDMTAEFDGEQRRSVIQNIPLGRVGLPADIAKAAVFLASDYADFITGEIMDVDGGFMMD